MSEKEWRELAVETVRNLSALAEEAQRVLRRAEEQLRKLESEPTD
jgi:hypothetical protein